MRRVRTLPTATLTTRATLGDTPMLPDSGGKNAGPVIMSGVAAAGLSPPRPLPPPFQEPAGAAAGAAGFLGGFVGPVAGQLGLPCSAFSRAYSFVVSISGVALGKCGPFQHSVPLL